MLKALAAFAAISVNAQLNALSTPAPCCKDADECEDFMKLCLSGNRMYCNVLPCTSSSPSVVVEDSCNPCPQGGIVVNGKCVDTVPATADGMCPSGYMFNPLTRACEVSYPPVQYFTDCPSASPSAMVDQHSPSSTPNKCCNDATDECLILARRCAAGDLTACGFVPCAPSPSSLPYAPSPVSDTQAPSSVPYATVPSLCFNPCTKGGIPYAYDSRTKTISCRIVTDAINGTCNSNYMMVNNTCVHEYTTLYSVQSCSPSPSASSTLKVEPSSSASNTLRVVPSSSASNTPKVEPSSSASNTLRVVPSSSASNTPKVVASRSASNTPKVVDRESSSPSVTSTVRMQSMTPSTTRLAIRTNLLPCANPCTQGGVAFAIDTGADTVYCRKFSQMIDGKCPSDYPFVDTNGHSECYFEYSVWVGADFLKASCSPSPSMTPKVVDTIAVERTQSPSMTPKIVNRESSSPSNTPKVADTIAVERTQSPSMTSKVVDRESSSPSMTPKIVDRESSSPSMTPKVVDTNTVERTQSPSMTPKVVPSSSASNTPKVVDRESSSPSMTPKVVERTQSASMTPKIVDTVVSERTVSSSARPSNVDVHDYTNRPVEPLYTRKPDCNFWSCPAEYEVTNVNGKVTCKYYKSAEYNQITLPDSPEGQTGGFYNEYYCPRGTKLITIQGAVEAEKYWCEGFTDAVWSPCPSVSSTPSMTYKNQNDIVRSSSPNRSPIADAASTVAFPSRRVSPRISPKFSRFPWFTPVMSKKPLFGTSINGALTFPQASISLVNKLKELQVHLSCALHVDVDKVRITSVVRNINGTKYDLPFDISNVEMPLIGCYKLDSAPAPALARMLQSVNGDIVVNYVMTDSTAEVLSVDPTVIQAAIASDPAIIDFGASMGSTSVDSSANVASAPSGDGISSSNGNNTNFGAVTGIAVVFGAILAVVGVVGGAKYAQHRKRVAKNSKVIRFSDETKNNPLTYDKTKQMFTPTPTVNYIV